MEEIRVEGKGSTSAKISAAYRCMLRQEKAMEVVA